MRTTKEQRDITCNSVIPSVITVRNMAKDIDELQDKLKELKEHLEMFCTCPSHGASLTHIPNGEIEE